MRDRRWWVLGPLLVMIVLLLSRGMGQDRAISAPEPTRAGAVVAGEGRGAESAPARGESAIRDAEGDAAADEPRHPEIGFRGRERLMEHFRKHGREFKARTPEEYLRLAQLLRERPKSEDVLMFVRNDAVTCKFDRTSGAFVAYNSDGTLRTFFRPNDGEAYFERQKSRAYDSR